MSKYIRATALNSSSSALLALTRPSLPLFSLLLSSLWAEDSLWDVHQPPAGQTPSGDRRSWEDWSQRDGKPDHGGRVGRPRVSPPQDAVLTVHQSGSKRVKREGHRTEELSEGKEGGTRDRWPQNNIPPSQTSVIPRCVSKLLFWVFFS